MKSNKGITLVALIITITVLLILAAISIDIAIDGKLFDISQETVSQANNKLGEEQNRVDSLINEWDNLETGISGNTSGNEPEDTTPPTVEIEIQGKTSNSITINVIASDNESGMVETPTYTYYIKKSTESTYEEKTSNNNASYTFTGLTQGITYDIKVEVQGDKAGNKGEGTTQATTGTVTSGTETGAITFGGTTWSNNQASITISTNTSYTIEYQVNSMSGTWTTLTNGGTVSGLNHGDTVYARLTDGINAGQYASTSIEDKIAPQITVNKGTVTSNSIAVSVVATDGESGMASSLTYTYYIKATTGNTYEQKASNGSASYTFTGLTQGITYDIKVEVTGDKAGNKGEGTTQATTGTVTSGTTTGAITFGSTTWSSNQASITISTNTSYTIEYQVNSISGTWTTITNGGKVTGLNHGDTVYARLTDGTNAGQYASTSIEDKTAPNVTVNKGTTTSNNIRVSVTASDGQSGMASSLTYKYYIKKSTEGAYTRKASNSSSSYTFTGLTQGTTYNIKVEVTGDKAGNKGTGTTQATTGTVTSGTTTGAITFGSTTWSNNKASITISTNTSYTIEYQVNSISGTWTTITNGGKVTGLNHGDTVYARLTDGTNAGQYASTSIEDKTAPNVTVNKGTTTSNSIRVSVTASDGQSGMASSLTYKYYIKKSTEGAYTRKASNSSSSYTFTGLTQGTTYNIKVEVTGDKAGNKGEGTTQATTGTVTSGTTTGAITFGSTTWSSNQASITISTNTSYTIEYQVNSISGTWTTLTNGGTVSGLNHGDTVYARLTDGTNAGQYASTSIEDKTAPNVTVNKGTTTSNSIRVSVTASDGQSGMASSLTYKYYIKKSTEGAYTRKASNSSSSYTFTGLTQGTTYNIKVEVTGDKAGNKGTGTTTGTTGTVTSGTTTGAITFGSTTWSSNQASITISTNTSYTIEYQVNGINGQWTTITNGGKVTGLNHGDTVYARLTDGINAGDHASASITDGTAPTISSFTVTAYDTTSITVSASATDNQSGIYSYQFQYKLSTASSYTTAKTTVTSNGTCTYTYTGLADDTAYNLRVIVTDKANKASNKTVTQTTEKEIVTATVIDQNPTLYYGKEVENYGVTYDNTSGASNKWRIFYADENNIYLITDDYIHADYAPDSANNTIYINGNNYKLSMNNVYSDYTGAANIDSTLGNKWLSAYYPSNTTNRNTNIRAVAYMLDTDIWDPIYKNEYAEYAIGGPTLEMFCASYKDTHTNRYIECTANSTGYQVRWQGGSFANSISGIPANEFNSIYIKKDYSKANAMWLASPSAGNASHLMTAYYYRLCELRLLFQPQSWLSCASLSKI